MPAAQRPGRRTALTDLGDYRLERLIARGGSGLVYEARRLSTGRRVALKLLDAGAAADEECREQFERGARAAMELAHPNVLPVHDWGEADGQPFIAMPLVEGEELGSIIAREGPLAVERVLAIADQIACALDAAHAIGLVHRDVKPGNVMIEQLENGGEHCWVLDFGLAVDREGAAAGSEGAWAGTPAYVSPEQLRGESVDGRTDVYALGVLVFHALAGRTPFQREHEPGTLLAHLHAPPPSLTRLRPDLPRGVDLVIARALAKAPDARHPSARELADDLAGVLAAAGRATADEAPEAAYESSGNLPPETSSFVGRWAETEKLSETLPATRLVSIVGPGGVGKTTFAVHLATRLQHEYAGAWLVELDTVADAAGLEVALARTLGLRLNSAVSTRDGLIEVIGRRHLLLILDNCEQIVDPVGTLVAELLAACPRLTAIVTSRRPLTTDGEHVHALAPLGVPAADDEPQDILTSDSARLLFQRAAEQGVSVEFDADSAAALAAICSRLEGIPLAIELAAAQLRTLSVDDLAGRLEADLRVLEPAEPPSSAHGQTLDGVIESSWRLMDENERHALARLAVFADAFTLDAAEAVAGNEAPQRLIESVVLGLADKSLLQVDAGGARLRFRMLQPVREFCLRHLAAAELLSAREAHRQWHVALAEQARPEFDGARSPQWLERLDDEHVNVVSAIESGIENGDQESALRIAAAMRQYWAARGLAREGIDLITAALRSAGSDSPALRAEAHSAAGHLAAVGLGDIPMAEHHALEALQLARSVGDNDTAAEALTWLSWSETFGGRAAEGLARALEGLSTAQTTPHATVVGRLLDAQAIALEQLGDAEGARRAYERAKDIFDRAGYATGVATVENHLGDLALGTGDLLDAASHFSLARTTAEEAGDGASVAMAALNLALIDELKGRPEDARELFLDCLLTNHACGDRANVAFSIFGLALTEPEPARAIELHGGAAHRLGDLEIQLSPLEVRLQSEELARLRAALGRKRFQRLVEKGQDLSVEDIIGAIDAGDLA